MKRHQPERPAAELPLSPLRALLHATFVACLAYREALVGLWARGDIVMRGAARFLEVDHHVDALEETCRILLGRYASVPPRRRPRYRGRLKVAVLDHGQRFRIAARELAGDFGVAPSTLYRWQRVRRAAPPGANAIGSACNGRPPVRRIADPVRNLSREMKAAGFPGSGSIRAALLLHGCRLSKRSVGRLRNEPDPRAPVARRFTAPPAPAHRRHERRCGHAPRSSLATSVALGLPNPRCLSRAFAELASATGLQLGRVVVGFRRLLCDTRQARIDGESRRRTRRSEQRRILEAHFGRVRPRDRPRYTPELRLAILVFKSRFGLSSRSVAQRFQLHRGTVSEWSMRADETPAPPLLAARPPLRSVEQAIERAVAFSLPRLQGAARTTLLASLLTISADIVPRCRSAGSARLTTVERGAVRRSLRQSLVARHPNHYWLSDVTHLGSAFRLAAVLDAYSRRVLAWRIYLGEPSVADVLDLLSASVATHGSPAHLITDQGPQFTAAALDDLLDPLGIDHRLGAVGEKGSIAIIERFWRTLKTALDLSNCRPILPDVLAERVAAAVDWYNNLRPHQSLGSATPAGTFSGVARPVIEAQPAPRGSPGEPCPPLGLAIRYALEAEQRLPYLERIAA